MATGVSPDVETFAAAASAENLEQAANALRERGFDTHVVAEPNGDEYVASTDYKGWSLYGAPWLQTVAITCKSVGLETGENKRKRLP